jgi:hypothetical protein
MQFAVSAATEASKNPPHLPVGPTVRTHAVFFSAHYVPNLPKQINRKTTHKNTPLLMADPVVRPSVSWMKKYRLFLS